MKMLVKMLGGSTSYGLNTPESDLDYRGVFVNTDSAKILGLEKNDHIQKQETDDIVYYEVRKFFELLKNGNTGALEILFSEDEPLEITDEFKYIRENKFKFVDTDKMFKCLLGYMQGERRLANGERTGQLGSKRKAQLDTYGFSPKNSVQLLRLAYCGRTLYQKGYFPVNVKRNDSEYWEKLFSIKTEPENYTKEELNKLFDEAEQALKDSYNDRKFSSSFDAGFANQTLLKIYLPHLMESYTGSLKLV
jgi:predicted nucleotidyltransferase